MDPEPFYYVWEKALPPSVCDSVIAEWDDSYAIAGAIEDDEGAPVVDRSTRDANTVTFGPTHWVHALPLHYALLANQRTWRFDVAGIETSSLIRYGPGGRYSWHQDSIPGENGEPDIHPRVLSIVACLTDPADYEGGAFRLMREDGTKVLDERTQARGSVTIFPSLLWHSVEPVTSGERFSLASWVLPAGAEDSL